MTATTANLTHLGLLAATGGLVAWGNLAMRHQLAAAERANAGQDATAPARRLLAATSTCERQRFRLVNTLATAGTLTLAGPIAAWGVDHPTPKALAAAGLGCLLLALVWLGEFARRPLLPHQPGPLAGDRRAGSGVPESLEAPRQEVDR